MGCFVVPAAEAVVVAVVKKVCEAKEKKTEVEKVRIEDGEGQIHEYQPIKASRKIGWLFKLLVGGAILLAAEHLWHGEVTPWFPFLTAMNSSESAWEMFYEMATVGVSMTVMVTTVWGVIVGAVSAKERALFGHKEKSVRE